jgi:hypothetical protein
MTILARLALSLEYGCGPSIPGWFGKCSLDTSLFSYSNVSNKSNGPMTIADNLDTMVEIDPGFSIAMNETLYLVDIMGYEKSLDLGGKLRRDCHPK